MNQCERFQEHITPHVDGELRGSLLQEFEVHLQECPVCMRQIRAQQAVKQLVRNRLPAVEAPPQLRLDILRLIEGLQAPRGLWAKRVVLLSMRPVAALAAAAVVLLMVAGAWMGGAAYEESRLQAHLDHLQLLSQPPVTARAATADSSPQTIVGRLVCIGGLLKHRYGVDYDCSISGHCLGLQTSDGALWNIVQNQSSTSLFLDLSRQDQEVRVTGRLFANAHYINVDNYEVISGD